MPQNRNLSWTSALIGAAVITAVYLSRPRRPEFRVISLTSPRLNFLLPRPNNLINRNLIRATSLPLPPVSADLIVTVNVTNPNILPVRYAPSSLSIFYDGSLLGVAHVPAGSQPSRSHKMLRLQARFNGLQLLLVRHAKRFFSDLAKRRICIDGELDLCGRAKGWWGPKFNVHLDSRIVVDPLRLDIVDQESVVSRMRISL